MFEIVDTYLPCFEVLAYVVPHLNAQTGMVIRGHVFLMSSYLALFIFFFISFIIIKSVVHLFLDRWCCVGNSFSSFKFQVSSFKFIKKN